MNPNPSQSGGSSSGPFARGGRIPEMSAPVVRELLCPERQVGGRISEKGATFRPSLAPGRCANCGWFTVDHVESLESVLARAGGVDRTPRRATMVACPRCFQPEQHLGSGEMGCGRHIPTEKGRFDRVDVREDYAVPADVEIAAESLYVTWAAGFGEGPDWEQVNSPLKEAWRRVARTLLAKIFKEVSPC